MNLRWVLHGETNRWMDEMLRAANRQVMMLHLLLDGRWWRTPTVGCFYDGVPTIIKLLRDARHLRRKWIQDTDCTHHLTTFYSPNANRFQQNCISHHVEEYNFFVVVLRDLWCLGWNKQFKTMNWWTHLYSHWGLLPMQAHMSDQPLLQ